MVLDYGRDAKVLRTIPSQTGESAGSRLIWRTICRAPLHSTVASRSSRDHKPRVALCTDIIRAISPCCMIVCTYVVCTTRISQGNLHGRSPALHRARNHQGRGFSEVLRIVRWPRESWNQCAVLYYHTIFEYVGCYIQFTEKIYMLLTFFFGCIDEKGFSIESLSGR